MPRLMMIDDNHSFPSSQHVNSSPRLERRRESSHQTVRRESPPWKSDGGPRAIKSHRGEIDRSRDVRERERERPGRSSPARMVWYGWDQYVRTASTAVLPTIPFRETCGFPIVKCRCVFIWGSGKKTVLQNVVGGSVCVSSLPPPSPCRCPPTVVMCLHYVVVGGGGM